MKKRYWLAVASVGLIFSCSFSYATNRANSTTFTLGTGDYHFSTKRQILALVAADFPMTLLRARFPSISIYQLKAARKHAICNGNQIQ